MVRVGVKFAHRGALRAVVTALAITQSLIACGDSAADGTGSDAAVSTDAAVDAASDAASQGDDAATDAAPVDAGDSLPQGCDDVLPDALPEELACTGLYADFGAKELASGVREFKPAHELWSDGAAKTRFIKLPAGETIDASDAAEWKFPIGTKLWKEFVWKGARAETRLFWKVGATRWLRTSYQWNADESRATRFAGGEVQVAGESYYIPSAKECDQCHKGRTDKVLGFEASLLGLDGATGVTLANLIDEGALSGNTITLPRSIGDDGTGQAAPALAWLHVNCGVSCHNGNSASEAYKTNLRLRLDPAQLDGRAVDGFDTLTTAVGMPARTPAWIGQDIIVAGDADASLLMSLISARNANGEDQMPPIATRVIDPDGIAKLTAWIDAMGNASDAGSF